MRILLPVVMAAVPLVIAPHLLYYFDVTPKILVLVFGAALALIFFLRERNALERLSASAAGRWFFALLGAHAISLIISAIFSTDALLSWHGGTWRRFGVIPQFSILVLVLMAALHLSRSNGEFRPVLRAIVAAGGVGATYGILQYFGLDPLLASGAYRMGEGARMIVRPPGTMGQATYFATYLLFPAFLGAALFCEERHRAWRAGAAAISSVCVFAIVLSGTRAALAGALIGGLLLVFWVRPRVRLARVAVSACVLAALAGFYFSPAGLRLQARVKWSLEDVRGGARLPLWRDSLHMASQRPWIGYGPETFAEDFPQFQSVELARAYPDFYHESPHNIFLDAFASQGLLGLMIAAGYAALGFYAARQARRAQPVLAPVLASCLAAVFVAQQFTSFVAANALYYGLLVAMLVALVPAGTLPALSLRIPRSSAALAASGGIAIFALFGIHLFLADYFLDQVRTDLENVNVSAAVRDYGQVLAWQTAGFSGDLYYSHRMAELAVKAPAAADRLRAWQEALAAGIRATQSSEDRQNGWYHLATLYAAENKAGEVERCLRAAIACAPNWFKPHWVLAQLLRGEGKLAEAQQQAELAASLDNGKNPEVNQTLYEIRLARHTGNQ